MYLFPRQPNGSRIQTAVGCVRRDVQQNSGHPWRRRGRRLRPSNQQSCPAQKRRAGVVGITGYADWREQPYRTVS